MLVTQERWASRPDPSHARSESSGPGSSSPARTSSQRARRRRASNDASGGLKGTVGADVSQEDAVKGARMCGVNLLAQISAALDGDLERVVRVVKLGGFVQVAGDFEAIPAVINGCSDLMVEVFGDKGRHARSAVGVYKLPLGFAVEVDAIVEVR